MKKRVRDGEVSVEGTSDVLTKVLGNPEKKGRVRGQGTYVTQSTYFNLPRKKKTGKSMDERIQEGIKKYMREESERIVRERDSFWSAEIEKLKSALCEKIDSEGSPNIGSQQASCSKGIKELELAGAKKRLNLLEGDYNLPEGDQENGKVDVEEKNEKVVEGGERTEKIVDVVEKIEEAVEGVHLEDDQELVVNLCVEDDNDTEWGLAINSPNNIVAHAAVDTKSQILHGKPLTKENARVSITRVIQGSEKIPFPIQDEIITVEQAVGTYIAWPKDLITELKTTTARQNGSTKVKFVVIY